MKLSFDEQDALHDIVTHDGFKAVWKEADAILKTMQDRVLNYDLATGNPTELSHHKCRAEGAARIIQVLKERMDKHKQTSKRLAP